MEPLVSLLWDVTALAVAFAGFVWIFGAKGFRDRLLRVAAGIGATAVFVPVVVALAAEAVRVLASHAAAAARSPDVALPDIPLLPALLLGHAALAIAIVRRRWRGPEARRRAEQEFERARSRERTRIAAPPQEDEP